MDTQNATDHQGGSIIDLYIQASRELLGSVTEADLKVLVETLEAESTVDQDYFITRATLDLIADGRASDHMVALLRRALAESDGVDIKWEQRRANG